MTGHTNTPKRVRVVGDLFHPQVPDGAVYVGRQAPGLRRSELANPFKAGATSSLTLPEPFAGVVVRTQVDAVDLFRQLSYMLPGFHARVREVLRGRNPACWCRPDQPCHADVLIEIVTGED